MISKDDNKVRSFILFIANDTFRKVFVEWKQIKNSQ